MDTVVGEDYLQQTGIKHAKGSVLLRHDFVVLSSDELQKFYFNFDGIHIVAKRLTNQPVTQRTQNLTSPNPCRPPDDLAGIKLAKEDV